MSYFCFYHKIEVYKIALRAEETNFDCYRLLLGISASPFLYSLRCHRRILAMKTTSSIRTHKRAKIWACLNGAHSLTSFLPSIQRRPIDAKMGVKFYTLLYIFTYIKIHSRREKYALNKKNASHVKILCFG